MNCRPGDLAVIVHPRMSGHPVEVLYSTPVGRDYRLPDGHLALAEKTADVWVCRSMASPFQADTVRRGEVKTRAARYAAIEDRFLRPIRGDGVTDAEVRKLFEPSPAPSHSVKQETTA